MRCVRAAIPLLAVLLLVPAAFAHELTTPVIAPSVYMPYGYYSSPLVASTGRMFLTIWNTSNGHLYGSIADGVSEPPPAVPLLAHSGSAATLIAAGDDYIAALSTAEGGVQLVRIDERGNVVSVARPEIPPLYEPRLAWNGQHILLIGREGLRSYPNYILYPVRAYLLTRDGELVRAIGRVATPLSFAAAAIGNEFFVVTGDQDGLRLFRAGSGGNFLDNTPLFLPAKTTEWSNLRLAVRGKTLVIARWDEQRNAPILTLIEDGVVINEEAVSGVGRSFELTATATGYAMASRSAFDAHIFTVGADGKRRTSDRSITTYNFNGIAAAGDLVQVVYTLRYKAMAGWYRGESLAPVIEAVLSMTPVVQSRAAVASDGIDFLAAFAETTADAKGARYARFTRSGHGLDGPGRRLGDTHTGENYSYFSTAAAFGAGRHLVAWSDSVAGTDRVQAAFVDADGSIGTPFFVRNKASGPKVIWNGSSFLLLWIESALPLTGRIFGAVVSASGAVGPVRKISTEPAMHHENHGPIEVAWNGREYLVGWIVSGWNGALCSACIPPPPTGASAIHVSAEGVPREPKAIPIFPLPQSLPATGVHIAAAGQQFIVLVDRFERIDAVVFHANGVEAPRTIFEWLPAQWYREPGIVSDIIAERDGVLVAVRFGDATRSWILTRRLSAWGLGGDPPRGIEVGQPDFSWENTFDMAANAAGDTAIVGSESAHPGDMPRIHAHFVSEMPPAPPPPPAPRNVTAKIAGKQTTISWEESEGAEGYVIEIPWPSYVQKLTTTAADVRTYTVNMAIRRALRVRAYNGAGLSAPSELLPVDVTRQRSARP